MSTSPFASFNCVSGRVALILGSVAESLTERVVPLHYNPRPSEDGFPTTTSYVDVHNILIANVKYGLLRNISSVLTHHNGECFNTLILSG